MSKDWDVIAEEAMQRRKEKNTPWKQPEPSCLGCGVKEVSVVYPGLCNDCIKAAYDVLESMEK